jgi:hypothetical protein
MFQELLFYITLGGFSLFSSFYSFCEDVSYSKALNRFNKFWFSKSIYQMNSNSSWLYAQFASDSLFCLWSVFCTLVWKSHNSWHTSNFQCPLSWILYKVLCLTIAFSKNIHTQEVYGSYDEIVSSKSLGKLCQCHFGYYIRLTNAWCSCWKR